MEEVSDWTQKPLRKSVRDAFFAMIRVRPRIVRTGSGYVAIRRNILSQSGGGVPGLRGAEDSGFFYRIAGRGIFVALKYPALIARRTGHYGPPDRGFDRSLAELLAFWIHTLSCVDWGREAYDLLLRHGGFGIIMHKEHQKEALKLASIPVVNVIRPAIKNSSGGRKTAEPHRP